MPLFNWVPPNFAKTKYPAGIILPLLSGSVPNNWSSFTAADGKFIVGAGNSYAAGTTGGSSSVAISGTTANGGAHTGSGVYKNQKPGTGPMNHGSQTQSHNHTVSDSATVEDVNREYVLIKADIGVDVLPPDVGVFGHQSLKHPFSNTHGAVDRFIKAGTVDGTLSGSINPVSSGYVTSSNGGHTHKSSTNAYDTYYGTDSYDLETIAGAHQHTGTLTTTLDTKYFYLSLWKHATAGCPHQRHMIAMWESATAPEGWALLDGGDGRPDLRDYFIRIGSEAQQGNFGGSNSSNWSISSMSSIGAHGHPQVYHVNGNSGTQYLCYHESSTGAHSNHTISVAKDYIPPFYALSFIIKL